MGVRCTVLGHVCDSTEFEQRRVQRPEGTVLVCREYQVCRHCGNREELYRNEQVLDPCESDEATPKAGTADAKPTDQETSTDESDDEMSDIEEKTETASPRSGRSERELDRQKERMAPDSSETEGETDGQERTDLGGPEPRVDAAESTTNSGQSVMDGATREAMSDGSGATAVTDDAVILTDSPDRSTQWPSETDRASGDSDTATRDRETKRHSSSDDSATPKEETGVEVLTDPDATAGTDEKGLECRTCGTEWTRTETSLRDGDLCPDCRRGYVQTSVESSTANVG